MPYHLVERADPEQRLALAANVPEHLIEPRRTLEQRQLLWVLLAHLKESRMKDPATGQREIGLDCVQFPLGDRKCTGIPTEDGAFVEQPGPFDPFVRTHRRPRLPESLSPSNMARWARCDCHARFRVRESSVQTGARSAPGRCSLMPASAHTDLPLSQRADKRVGSSRSVLVAGLAQVFGSAEERISFDARLSRSRGPVSASRPRRWPDVR
jgi:hypothetical protein